MSRGFRARHVSHCGVITVLLPAEETLELFTPEGERDWVPSWEPEYLFRADGDDEIDTVFRTDHDGEESLWIVLDHDLEMYQAAYARITPGSRLGTVAIDIDPIDETSCWVEVCYELTALSPAGNLVLERFDARAFRQMLDEWERRISTALEAVT